VKNWSIDTKTLAKYPEQSKIWQLEQLVNFGLDGEKISRQDLLKYWHRLNIDPQKKRYLKFLLFSK